MNCPTCGKRTDHLLVWTFVLLLITMFFGARACGLWAKGEPRRNVTRRVIELTPAGETVKAAHPDWDNTDCNLVAEKRIRLFMGKPKVLEAWGAPIRVIATQDAAEFKKETWILSGDRKVTFDMIGMVESFEEPGSSSITSR